MTAEYGIKYANDKFLEYWEKQTFGAALGDCTTFNPAFIKYAKKYGFYQALFGGAALLVYPIAIATEVIFDAGQVITNTTGAISTTSKILKVVLPVALIGLGAWAGYTYLLKPLKTNKKQS